VFARLVRMNDGAFHARHRPEVAAAAERLGPAQVEAAAHAAASDLAGRVSPDAFLSALPVQAMARLLGVPDAELQRTVDGVRAFVRGIGPGADAQAVAQASEAALTLMAQGEAQGLPPVAAANRIAFMQQALDATAGLVGNAIAALRSGEASLEGTAFVERVAREDPAVHNTRRFAAQDLELAGARIASGQGVVLVLVDGDQGALAFGDGAHACPGERIALHLAAATLRTLRALDALPRFGPITGYRPLPNARIPLFTLGANAWSP
jgi:cytochrome P450